MNQSCMECHEQGMCPSRKSKNILFYYKSDRTSI